MRIVFCYLKFGFSFIYKSPDPVSFRQNKPFYVIFYRRLVIVFQGLIPLLMGSGMWQMKTSSWLGGQFKGDILPYFVNQGC